MKKIRITLFGTTLLFLITSAIMAAETEKSPLALHSVGSIMFGGTVATAVDGETFRGDHGYANYYIPQNSRQYPLVMWHGIGQSGKTWETTPDGREGYQSLLPRRGYSAYIIDHPRRGRAGRTQATEGESSAMPTVMMESGAFNSFRLGVWLPPSAMEYYEVSQFPKTPAALDQFMRWQTPDTGPEPFAEPAYRTFMGKTAGMLLQKIGPAVMVTHSNSGQYGWATAMNNPGMVKAIVAYEPGAFAFPEDDLPSDVPTNLDLLCARQAPQRVSREDFLKLTKIPIMLVYGDNIPTTPQSVYGLDLWRVNQERAKQFVETINRNGGDATLVQLPACGIRGNTHFMFADLNNEVLADQLAEFLSSKGLDGRDRPHIGPKW